MRIILLGPPGSGKGTQGDLIEKRYGFPRISTGDILRRAVQERSPLGLEAEAEMKAGRLVSDQIVTSLVADRLHQPDCNRGYVLDGFPRTITQAKILEHLDGGRPEIALEFTISAEALILRLSSRRVCLGCGAVYNLVSSPPQKSDVCDRCGGPLTRREDDEPAVIRERLRVYEEEIRELRDYYERKKVLHQVEAVAEPEEIFKRVVTILEAELGQSGKIKTGVSQK